MTGPAADGDRPVRVEVVVRGRVQGVGFRMFAARMAIDRGLGGWVANEPDGSVRCVAQGSRSDLEAFTRDLAAGPPGATVERLAISWSEAVDGLDRFAIRSGWHGGD